MTATLGKIPAEVRLSLFKSCFECNTLADFFALAEATSIDRVIFEEVKEVFCKGYTDITEGSMSLYELEGTNAKVVETGTKLRSSSSFQYNLYNGFYRLCSSNNLKRFQLRLRSVHLDFSKTTSETWRDLYLFLKLLTTKTLLKDVTLMLPATWKVIYRGDKVARSVVKRSLIYSNLVDNLNLSLGVKAVLYDSPLASSSDIWVWEAVDGQFLYSPIWRCTWTEVPNVNVRRLR